MKISVCFSLITIVVLCSCSNEPSRCTFNYSNCTLEINDKSLFINRLIIEEKNHDKPIMFKFNADSLRDKIDLCRLTSHLTSADKMNILSITFVLVDDIEKEDGKRFFLPMHPNEMLLTDSVYYMNELRY